MADKIIVEDFFNPEYCANFAAKLGSGFMGEFKYLFSLKEGEAGSEYLTPELLREYDGIYEDCKEIVAAYEYYRKKVKIKPAPYEDDYSPL